MDWIYGQIVGFLGNFFALMGNMGVELFELEWVSAIILFFSRLAWALFAVSVVVCAFECGIEYSTGRGNLQQCGMNIIKKKFDDDFVVEMIQNLEDAKNVDTINGETLFSAPSASLSFRGEGATVKLAEDDGNLLKVFVANKQTADLNPVDSSDLAPALHRAR